MDIYKDESRAFEERAADLVSKMTLEEKISQLGNHGAAIPRLGVPFYNYWSEASHGFFGPFKYRPMDVTSFPVCLAMSQSWDTELINRVATAISDECRAYYNEDGDELNFWCPTINLARDPRNGRSDENFGEDPLLAGKLAASYVRGMQGEDKKYLKTISTPKHYALNSSENNRHRGSDNVDEATLREYYTKVFQYAIREGGAQCIMTSYNRVNGVPSSCSETLLTTLLREEWGFDGFVVSDCGAVSDTYESAMFNRGGASLSGHYYAKNPEEASAMTLIAGTDMTCGTEHSKNLLSAMENGLIGEDVLDRALIRIFTTRFRLGVFDKKPVYMSLGRADICSNDKIALAREAADDTIVLLKNEKALLPLDKAAYRRILVVGPNAIYRELGGYSAGGMSKLVDTVVSVMALDGIKNELAGSGIEVSYEKGWCTDKERGRGGIADALPGSDAPSPEMMSGLADFFGPNVTPQQLKASFGAKEKYLPDDPDKLADGDMLFARALAAAKKADCVIVVAGTDSSTASEEHDRDTLELPYGQNEKIEKLLEANPNTVVVLTTLGAVTGSFIDKAHTLLNAHFAGQEQGAAIADVLFGKVNPSAKLTATWYRSLDDLPHINDYGIRKNDTLNFKPRTYMYFEKQPLFPFGFGLSYTAFEYSNLRVNAASLDAGDTLEVRVDVTNTGRRDGAEAVELYVGKIIPEGTRDNKPVRQLAAFAKVRLAAGETRTVTLSQPVSNICFWSYLQKKMIVEPGSYCVEIGRSSADIALAAVVNITGEWDAPLVSVYAVSDKYVLDIGESARIDVTAALEDTSRLCTRDNSPVFESGDTSVVRVDERGCVTAVGSGAASVVVSVSYKGCTKSRRVPFAVK